MKNTKYFLIALLIFSLVFSFASCKKQTEYPVEINNIVIDVAPTKVGSLSSVTNSAIKLMGYDNRLATEDFGSPLNINIENIIASNISVLFTPVELSNNTSNQLSNVGIKVVKLSTPENYEQLKEYYKIIATVMGGNITGKEIALNINKDMDESFSNIETFLEGKEKFSYVFLYRENTAANNTSFVNNILAKCGGNNKVTEENEINNTKLLELNPDLLIVNTGMKEKLMADTELANLSAIKNNKIVEIEVRTFNLMGEDFMKIIYDILDTQYPDFLEDSAQKE